MMSPSLSVVVLTFNEEKNLEACLASVSGWPKDLVVVDSGSTDATIEIARRFGARILSHPFETHSKQWAWALANADLAAAWVLGLDADQRVLPGLRVAVDRFLSEPGSVVGAYVRRRQVFRGKWIRHGGYYPKYLLKLFRRDAVQLDPGELVDHHFHVDGPTVRLDGDIVEANRNEDDLDTWLIKHVRYARLQALQEAQGGADGRPARFFGRPDERTRALKKLWARLPLFLRPALYFLWRYVVRLGFLDGREGFVFHFMQGFWYRVLVDANRSEMQATGSAKVPADCGPLADGESRRSTREEIDADAG